MRVYEWLIHELANQGVDALFGVPGYANSLLFIEADKSQKITPVLARHESSAAWLAIGYQEGGRRFGVCTATSGAGVTNSVSGVVAAYLNSVPLMMISGQVETSKFGRGGFQELTGFGPRGVDACQVFSSMTKYNERILSANDVPMHFKKAVNAMLSGRPGPVHLNIPIDILREEIAPEYLNWVSADDLEFEIFDDKKAIDVVQTLKNRLNDAKAPMVLAGKGCRSFRNELSEFLNRIKIPYATTIHAKSYLKETEYHLGVFGVAGSPRCFEYFQQSDLIICLGSSLSEFTTYGFSEVFNSKKIFRVDIDENEFSEGGLYGFNVCMDLTKFFEISKDIKFEMPHPPVFTAPRHSPAMLSPGNQQKVKPTEIIDSIREFAPDNAYITADSGNNAVWVIHYLTLKPTQDFFVDVNTGCMGSGVMAAVGIKFANPRRPVIAICGDGGFLMNGIEVSTAAEHQLGILWIVMNDKKLGMVAQGDTNKYGAKAAVDFAEGDIRLFAMAMGVKSKTVQTLKELQNALADYKWDEPFLLDVQFDDSILPNVYSRVRRNETQA